MPVDRSVLVEAARVCACFNLRKTSRAVTRVFDEALERRGLRSTGFLTLVAIRTEGSPTLPRLAQALDLDRSTLTRNLKPLVEGGLVRTSTPRGSRTARAALTPRGARVLEQCVPLWREAQDRVEARVGKARWAVLLASLSNLASLSPGSRATG